MKVFIFGIDALDYDLVNLFRLKNLIQKFFGKIEVIEFVGYGSDDPFTPTVWASFLTGLTPEEHKVYTKGVFKNPFIDKIYQFQLKLGISRLLPFSLENSFLKPLGLNKRREDNQALWEINSEYFKKNQIETIFDITSDFEAFNIPTFNRRHQMESKDNLFHKQFLEKKISKRRFLSELHNLIDKETEEFIKILRRNNQLIMVYTHIADTIGHSLRGDLIAMWEIYTHLDENFNKLINNVTSETFIIVVSDHGMNIWRSRGVVGRHSNYSFYSVNQKLEKPLVSLRDFKQIIKLKLTK
jgi:predicted AlkP superfamily pyrophosphatase or phosphodiesterase